MKKNTLYIPLILLVIHLLSAEAFAFDSASHDFDSCSACKEVLTPVQVEKVIIILDEVSPKMRELRQSLREKRKELRNLHYNVDTDPEAMVQLGIELQAKRKAIVEELRNINQRFKREVGVHVRFKIPHSRGCSALQTTSYCPIYVKHGGTGH